MKRAKKGMSVIALVGAVAIILILLTTVTTSGINTAHNAKKIAFGSEIKMIQNSVDTYYSSNNARYPVTENAYELNFSNASSKNKKIFQDNEGSDKTSFTVYEIDYDAIDVSDLTYGKKNTEDDIYVISRMSGKVYYLKGLKIGNEIYYTVTDDINNLLSYNSEKNTVNSPIIKFEPSTTEWVNNDIEIKVTIPETCTLKSAKYDDNLVTLTDSKLTVSKNGTLTVTYTENLSPTEEKQAKYIVSNIDKEAPNVEVDANIVNISTKDSIGYIKITKKEDNLSGIKSIKFDYGDLTEVPDYFKTSGTVVKDDLIFVKSYNEKITLYIEDNAGNTVKEVVQTSSEGAYPVIPTGFEYLTGTVSTGYVIKNKADGNEFVWVPVENISEFIREEGYDGSKKQTYLTSNTTEPYTSASDEEKQEYQAMIESVQKYRGFYIARYEASKNTTTGKAQSLQNQTPWTRIKFSTSMTDLTGGAVGAARAVYPVSDASTKSAISTLCYGVQWDQTIRFLENNYSGIAKDYTGQKGNYGTGSVILTGSNSQYEQNNIYDMCGNVAEWTMEALRDNARNARGGNYEKSTYTISTRAGFLCTGGAVNVGFRIALYVK